MAKIKPFIAPKMGGSAQRVRPRNGAENDPENRLRVQVGGQRVDKIGIQNHRYPPPLMPFSCKWTLWCKIFKTNELRGK